MMFSVLTLIELCLAIVTLSCMLFLLHCFRLLQLKSCELYFAKRGPILLRSFLMVSGLNQTIVVPCGIIIYSILSYKKNNWYYLQYYSSYFLSSLSMCILLLRLLLQFINIRRAEEASDWKKQLDPNYNNWILEYYHILGNPKTLLRCALILTLIQIIGAIVIICLLGIPYDETKFSQVYSIITLYVTSIWFLQVILVLYLTHKLKQFVDYWNIRKEFKLLFTFLIIVLVTGVITRSLNRNKNSYIRIGSSTWTIINIVIRFFWNVSAWYISIIWVYKSNEKKLKIKAMQRSGSMNHINTNTSTNNCNKNKNKKKKNKNKNVRLQKKFTKLKSTLSLTQIGTISGGTEQDSVTEVNEYYTNNVTHKKNQMLDIIQTANGMFLSTALCLLFVRVVCSIFFESLLTVHDTPKFICLKFFLIFIFAHVL